MERSLPSKYEVPVQIAQGQIQLLGVLWELSLPLLSSELQNGLHGVQASSAKVGDVALHANGFQPLRDRSIGDPIRSTAAGEPECYPKDRQTPH